MNDTTKGLLFMVICAVILIGGFTSSLYVIGIGIVALPLLSTFICIKDGRGTGPMTRPVIVIYALMLIGIIGSIALREPTVPTNYFLGFTPGAACTIFLIWIASMVLPIMYGVHFRSLLSDREKEEYDRELREEAVRQQVKEEGK